ncbi:1-deoxy-D-xylulose-5-phosphate reductoisomerase [Loktanella sp. SALINAS62]|uniref:1-deoxy-D-xylulose-5-phosphate reductoisomerase n=1 Tax=Loktanella sp. SALINAS62 TaxID=2706124 RepID=UPI001B8AAADC|nr:1-deoxy-D-xylulose-5-phosphate reductoisomerase [Loktanella sp. SALINAS62]MBS1303647.1 1-deoxy-D-xylulose-5-phosphate reductoisomerase [Loktanella sp. SALINAS62]
MRRISILGATGSIGQSTIDLIKRRPDDFEVVALTGGCNAKQLARDAIALRAQIAVVDSAECYAELRDLLAGTGISCGCGAQAIADAARMPADWIMSAIVGSAGLPPGMAALEQGTTLALANKESLVTAGPLLMDAARRYGARILPVDSEHSAVFQALVGEPMDAVERVIITASGGAFRDWPMEKLQTATVAQASAHPNWDMGQRITIDSASMFNKALELIETREFFGISPKAIEVIVHPESLIHALVGFRDGALMAHVGPPDMRHAIGYALNWPDRSHLPVDRLDLAAIGQFTFRAPDDARWPALRLAREVMATRGKAGAVFNAAKEAALDAFIAGQVGFMDMATAVDMTLAKMSAQSDLQNAPISLEDVMETDRLSRRYAIEALTTLG